jgi:solute:Na+ symporter, SSS family
VRVGRIATLTVMVIGGLWAPAVAGFEGVFTYIQMVWGFISPGIVAAFLFGLLWKRVPAAAAIGGMILGAPVYGALLWFLPGIAFLHHMAITFIAISLFIVSYTLARPMTVAYTMPQRPDIALETEPAIRWLGGGVILATITLYVIFW